MRLRAAFLAFVSAQAGWGGCAHTHPVPQDELATWMQRYYDTTSLYAELADPSHFVHTGHQAGNFEEYPRSINGSRVEPRGARNVTDLMDHAFGELGLTAIEIDVQMAESPDGPLAVIVHDQVKRGRLSAPAADYARANTVEIVLDHFAAEGYHHDGHRVFFELKSRKGWDEPLSQRTRDMLDRLAAAVSILDQRPDAERIRRSIGFLAFSYPALNYLRLTLDGDGPTRYGYYLMTTSNRFADWVFEWTPLPPFNQTIRRIMSEAPWIRGTVFAPRWVNRFGMIFNGINDKRIANGLDPLELHVAVYAQSFDEYVAIMRRAADGGRSPVRHVTGFVYDIQRD